MNIIEKFRNREFAVNCKTQEEAASFVGICYENDIKWALGDAIKTRWEVTKEQTCYSCRDGRFLCYEIKYHYESINVKVISFKKFMKKYAEFKKWESRNIAAKEEKTMCGNGKLNKGINEKLCQDFYRGTTQSNGSILFNKISVINVAFVQHDGNDKIYAFENPSDKRLVNGTRVQVKTNQGLQDGTVVSSIKLPKKYLSDFMLSFANIKNCECLQPVVGVYKKVESMQLVTLAE